LRTLDADATGEGAIPIASDPVFIELIRNPLGGYVEVRTIAVWQSATDPDPKSISQLRWVDESLQPIGGWYTAYSVTGLRHNQYRRVFVDQRGRALVLSFTYPPSFGSVPPPSDWVFSARWMGPDGPLTAPFEPTAPTFTSSNGTIYFANWGTILPLRAGGFAMFHAPAPSWSGGTISPSGWYALYPSAEGPTVSVPSWLRQYDGSLQLLAGARGYAATYRDPNTCARTIMLIAPSGRTCFSAPVEGSDNCDLKDAISPDGTLVLQNNCQMHWWPGLARPAQ
jgi:hypothetical protein